MIIHLLQSPSPPFSRSSGLFVFYEDFLFVSCWCTTTLGDVRLSSDGICNAAIYKMLIPMGYLRKKSTKKMDCPWMESTEKLGYPRWNRYCRHAAMSIGLTPDGVYKEDGLPWIEQY
jgi:hypothetical protein